MLVLLLLAAVLVTGVERVHVAVSGAVDTLPGMVSFHGQVIAVIFHEKICNLTLHKLIK